MDVREVLTFLLVLFASLGAVTGIIVVLSFFRNKLKELFDDVNYFIFFFLAVGYALYAVGEVSFYLIKVVFGDVPAVSMADLYWVSGGALIFLSFVALAITMFRKHWDPTKLMIMTGLGGLILAIVLYILFGITLTGGQQYSLLAYFYPIISSLIVIFSLNIIVFLPQHGYFSRALILFFLASVGILLGDIFFTHGTASGTYATGITGVIADSFYLAGYALSWIAFVILLLKMNHAADANMNFNK